MRITLILTVFFLLFSVQGAAASTIYAPDDYKSIQTAVDNASERDTIVVRDGIYRENVNVTKQLIIRSQNGSSNCTVFGSSGEDVRGYRDVFTLSADGITIEGFTIISSRDGTRGIKVESDNNTITENYITGNDYGIWLHFTRVCEIDGYKNNTIKENTITNNSEAAIALVSKENKIVDNNISNNRRLFAIPIPGPIPCGDIHCYTYVKEDGDRAMNASVSIPSDGRYKMAGEDGWANFTDLPLGPGPEPARRYEVKAKYESSIISENVTLEGEFLGDVKTVVEFDFSSMTAKESAFKPSAPRDVRAFPGFDRVELTWSRPNETGGSIKYFKVYRGTGDDEKKSVVATTLKKGFWTSPYLYTDIGLTEGQTYYYWVSAVNSAGEGPKSNEVKVTPGNLKTSANVTRTLSQSVEAGEEFEVVIRSRNTSENGAMGLKIFEDVPQGFSLVDWKFEWKDKWEHYSDRGDVLLNESGDRLKFRIFEDPSEGYNLTYTLQAPNITGTYGFRGTCRFVDPPGGWVRAIGGDTKIVVSTGEKQTTETEKLSTEPANETMVETTSETNGFESVLAVIGLVAAAYLIRRFS